MHYNRPPWLEKSFEIYFFEMAKNTLQSWIMVGENFEIYFSEMAKNTLQLSTMVGENFEIYFSEMPMKSPIYR